MEASQHAKQTMETDTPVWQQPIRLVKRNWRAALTVSLVNIPLSISLAIASGGTPVQGCATAIFSGLMAGAFGGSSYNIYGPAGALTSILNQYAVRYGAAVLPWFALWTSLFVFVFFALKIERYVLYLPWSVMEGFTLAIAFLIGLNQLNFIFGLDIPKKEHFYENLGNSFANLGDTLWEPTVFFLVFFPMLYALSVKYPRIPWIIILAVIGIILGYVLEQTGWDKEFPLPTLKGKYGELSFTVSMPKWADQGSLADMVAGSLSVGFICLLETLITAKIADNIADAPEPFDAEKETAACGIANVVVGVMGGLPCTAVLARTKLNIMSGTKGKFSQFLNGVFCVVICLALLPAFTYLPLSVCACILVLIAVRMAPTGTLMHLWHNDKTEFWLMVFVCVISVGLDPTYGLVLGMVLAFIMNADNVAQFHTELRLIDSADQVHGQSRLPLLTVMPTDMRSSCVGAVCGHNEGASTSNISRPEEVHIDMAHGAHKAPSTPCVNTARRGTPTVDEAGVVWQERAEEAPVACYEPRGALTYVNADAIEAQMKRLQNLPAVLVDLDKVYFMDIDGVDRVGKMVERWKEQHMLVVVCGTEGQGKSILSRAAWLSDMREAGLVAPDTATGYQLLLDLRAAEPASDGTGPDVVESSPLLSGSPKKKLDKATVEPVPYAPSTPAASREESKAKATTEIA